MDAFQKELCTVTPTIFKTCKNDNISVIGTCYEDSCCTSVESATSWYYRAAQLSHVIFSSIGIVLVVVYMWKYAHKHILPTNIRVLVNIILSLIFVHSIDISIFHTHHVISSFYATMDNPCWIRVRVDFCAPYRYTFSFCILCLAFCQYTLYADRIICILWKSYHKYQKPLLFTLLLQLFIIPTALILWIYREEDSQSYLLSCLNIPLNSMVDLSFVTAAVFPINIICFFLSIILFKVFERKQKSSRFDMNRHFKAAVDVQSSEFLYRVTATQAIFIIIYPILSLSMRYSYEDVERSYHLTFATLSYVFSIYSMFVPLIMIKKARETQENRQDKIWSHVKLKSVGSEGADNYFNSLKSQWG